MKRNHWQALVDLLALLGLVLLIGTGLVLRYRLPPGSGRRWSLLGFTRHEWGDFHFWIALTLALVIAIHLVLHWKWIVSLFRGAPGFPVRVVLGLVGALTLLVFMLGPFAVERAPVEAPHTGGGPAGEGRQR